MSARLVAQRSACRSERHALALKLQSMATLSSDEVQTIATIPIAVRSISAGMVVTHDGDQPLSCCIVLEGFAIRYKTLGTSRRQIIAFYAPGDIPDLQTLHLRVMDASLAALSEAKLGFIPHVHMRQLCLRHPRLADVLWRETLIEGARSHAWLTRLGRRDASARIAHLLCEIYTRLDAVGLAQNGAAKLPFRQAQLADALGISDVHVNRSLAAIKASGAMTLKRGVLTILDWSKLAAMGEFDPRYLHIKQSTQAEPV